MIGKMIHNAVNHAILKAVLTPIVAVAVVGVEVASKGVEVYKDLKGAQEERAAKAEKEKRASDPEYRERKEREERRKEYEYNELQSRLREYRCLVCGSRLKYSDIFRSRERHKDCEGSPIFPEQV